MSACDALRTLLKCNLTTKLIYNNVLYEWKFTDFKCNFSFFIAKYPWFTITQDYEQ